MCIDKTKIRNIYKLVLFVCSCNIVVAASKAPTIKPSKFSKRRERKTLHSCLSEQNRKRMRSWFFSWILFFMCTLQLLISWNTWNSTKNQLKNSFNNQFEIPRCTSWIEAILIGKNPQSTHCIWNFLIYLSPYSLKLI